MLLRPQIHRLVFQLRELNLCVIMAAVYKYLTLDSRHITQASLYLYHSTSYLDRTNFVEDKNHRFLHDPIFIWILLFMDVNCCFVHCWTLSLTLTMGFDLETFPGRTDRDLVLLFHQLLLLRRVPVPSEKFGEQRAPLVQA